MKGTLAAAGAHCEVATGRTNQLARHRARRWTKCEASNSIHRMEDEAGGRELLLIDQILLLQQRRGRTFACKLNERKRCTAAPFWCSALPVFLSLAVVAHQKWKSFIFNMLACFLGVPARRLAKQED